MEVFIFFNSCILSYSYLENSNKKEVEINITKETETNHVIRIMISFSLKKHSDSSWV